MRDDINIHNESPTEYCLVKKGRVIGSILADNCREAEELAKQREDGLTVFDFGNPDNVFELKMANDWIAEGCPGHCGRRH